MNDQEDKMDSSTVKKLVIINVYMYIYICRIIGSIFLFVFLFVLKIFK